MAETLTIRTASSTEIVKIAVPGPQGPKGDKGDPGDVAGLPLTTQGDTLYRGASENQRLPIGTSGQILKVSAGGIPEWGAAPATGVTSVTGTAPIVSSGGNTPAISISEATTSAAGSMSAADKTKLNNAVETTRTISAGTGLTGGGDLTANRTLSVSFGSSAGTAAEGNDARLSDSRNPLAHKNSHSVGQSDALAPSDIGAQSVFSTQLLVLTADETLTASRATNYALQNYGSGPFNLTLPIANNLAGDIIVVRNFGTFVSDVVIRQQMHDGTSGGAQFITLATILGAAGGNPPSQQYRFIKGNANNYGSWSLVPVDTHTHAAADITSGTLTHERGGLEADVSAYSGLVKISGGSTSAVTVTAAGEALLDDATNADQRTTLGLGTAAVANLGTGATDAAYGNHTHGNITNGGLVGTTSGLPLKTGTGGIVEAGAFGTSAGQFAEGNHTHTPADVGLGNVSNVAQVTSVSGTAPIVSSGGTTPTISVTTGTTAGTVAAGDHTHTQLHDKSHTMTDATSHTSGNWKLFYSNGAGAVQELALASTAGHVLQSNGATSAPSFAAASGGVTNVDATLADVMSVSGSNLVADDGGLVDSSNPALVWDDAAGKAVWANPLRRTSAGAFYVGVAPTTTALGTRALCIQADRSLAADRVPTGADSLAIGNSSQAQNTGSTAVGFRARANNTYAVSIGGESVATGNQAIAIGGVASASGAQSINISAYDAYGGNSSSATNSVGLNATADLRAMFATAAFRAVYWGGQTTSDTANVELNLDATATNRMVIAANTAVIADIFVIARRTDNSKFLAARRWVAIRRDGSNNTALIGGVQTIETDQSEGSPTWTFTIDADDTASVESLRVRVTGAASETVNWRVCAIYRVVA